MALMDEFKQERRNILHDSLRNKLAYFWAYYKWHAIIFIFVFAFIFTYLHTLFTRKDVILNGIILNANNSSAEDTCENIINDFAYKYKINLSEKAIEIDTDLIYHTTDSEEVSMQNYEAMQVMMTRSASAELNFIIGDADSMIALSYSDYFTDLSTLLPKEQYEQLKPYMYYMDNAIKQELEETYKKNEDISHITIPVSTDPNAMKEPIPVLIDISNISKLDSFFTVPQNSLVFGIVNPGETNTSILFLEYLLYD